MLTPPIEPMLAKPLGHGVPATSDGLSFEPKWDGFRCLLFRTSDGVVLQGRGRSKEADEVVDLAYAFPELVAAAMDQIRPDTVIDGEIVVLRDGRLDFGVLSSRLRPRSEAGGTNIAKLAATSPASLLAFDVLWSDGDWMDRPFLDRREELARLGAGWQHPLHLTPWTTDVAVATAWFTQFESAGVDGLIVKPLDEAYAPGKRTQGKVKHQRTVDVVVAGWRPHTKPGPDGAPIVGSLLLGLYDESGALHYVGASSAFTMPARAELVGLFSPLAVDDGGAHPWIGATGVSVPGGPSRWRREHAWLPLRPERVVEVTYDQMEGVRFRHVAGFVRWRPDRGPDSCGFDQLEILPSARIEDLLASTR